MDDRDLLRHLKEGGAQLYERPAPPTLDLEAITGTPSVAPSSPFDERSSASSPTRARRSWTFRPLIAVGGAMACVALGVVGGAVLFGGAADPAPERAVASTPTTPAVPPGARQVSLTRFDDAAPADAAAEVNVFTATNGRTVELRVKGLPVPKKGEFYELWVLGDAGKMLSLGIVRVDESGSADVRMPLPVSLRRFPIFDISLESGDGNPTHSGHSVLRSAAAA